MADGLIRLTEIGAPSCSSWGRRSTDAGSAVCAVQLSLHLVLVQRLVVRSALLSLLDEASEEKPGLIHLHYVRDEVVSR